MLDTPFLSGAPFPKKNPGSAPDTSIRISKADQLKLIWILVLSIRLSLLAGRGRTNPVQKGFYPLPLPCTTGERKDIFNSHNWTQAKRHSPRISRFTGTTELLTIPSELFLSQNPSSGSLKSFSICCISESPPFRSEFTWWVWLFDLQRNFSGIPLGSFRQSFASCVLKNRDFFCYREIFLPINTQRFLGYLLGSVGFWPSGPKPCGGNK